MILELPVKHVRVNQPFGVNYVDFYKKLGLKGHNGVDFKAEDGCPILAAHSGVVSYCGKDGDGGICVEIKDTFIGEGFKTIYYHLKDYSVKDEEEIWAGEEIGRADNTGKYTTGDHLHFGLKRIKDGQTIDYNNGYNGGIDPAPYFPANWDKSRAYHRYGQERRLTDEIIMRFKNPWLHRRLYKRNQIYKIYDNEFIYALVYGKWDIETVENSAMYSIWSQLRKCEYENGELPFK